MKGLVISKTTRTVFISITAVIAFYALLGFLILPAILSNQLPKIAQEQIHRELKIDNIRFNPFSMEVDIQGFIINNPDNSPFVSFKQLYLNVAVLQSIRHFSLNLDKCFLNSPFISIKRDKQANFNFSDLLTSNTEKEPEPSADKSIFPINIAEIMIAESTVTWDDQLYSETQHEEIHPLNLNIENFTTLVSKDSQIGVSLKLASGGQLQWQGELTLEPFRSSGKIQLNHVNFNKVWQLFLQDSVNFKIVEGSELITADYKITTTSQGIQATINDAQVSLLDIKISAKKDPQTLISMPNFKVSGIHFDWLNKQLIIDQISAQKARFTSWLNKDGGINYQALFVSDQANTQTGTSEQQETETASPWNVVVKKLNLTDFGLNFSDNTLAKPTQFNLSSINFSSGPLSNKTGASLPFNLDLTINKSGGLKIAGQAIAAPFSSQLQINASDIALNDFQPYLDQFVRLNLISGLFNLNAHVELSQQQDQPFAFTAKADSQINDFISRDKLSDKDFLNWKQLSLQNIELDLAANRYQIDTVKLNQPYTRVLIRKDKSINVNDIVIGASETKTKKEQTAATNKESTPPSINIAKFEITEGSSDFSDMSLILPFSAHINDLSGKIKGISSAQKARIQVDLNGKVAKLSPVIIKGAISPQQGDSAFNLDFKSMPLPLMTPYMAEFAGRKIEKGNMSLGLQYKIKNNELSASNNLLIEQLALGEEVENPKAVSLPLGLAIALLQDADGKIKLDVPITGNLENPEFSVAGVIMDALANVITKIVSSPFNAIASLIDSDDDISRVIFTAGESTLTDSEQKKLSDLVTALSSRPALKLEIKGAAFTKADWPALQAEALDQQIAQHRADEINKKNEKKILAKHIRPDKEEYQRVLADLFIENFPDLGEYSLFGAPRLKNPELGDFYTVAAKKLAAIIPPDKERLQKLAESRAQNIAAYLTKNQIPVERLFLLDVALDPEDADKSIASRLSLTAK